jgi:hypothetical protein
MTARRWVPVLGLIVLSVLFYWKLALTWDYAWFDHPDMCFIEIPRLQMQAREFHNGRFPLWDPYVWMGQPLIGQTQPGPMFPLNLLFGLLPLNNGYINLQYLNWYWVLIHIIAALGMYWLCRDLGRSAWASVLAGVGFAFGGFVVSAAWLDVVNGAIWTPLICLFFLRAARGRRPWSNAGYCGAVLGLAWLSGHHEIPMLVSYSLAAAWLYVVWRSGIRRVGPAALTFVVAALVAAMQLWPTFEYAQLSERWVGLERSVKWGEKIAYTAPTYYSMPVKALMGTMLDNTTTYGDNTPFLGVTIVGLAALGIATSWRRRRVRGLTTLVILGAIFALGALTPLHGLMFSFLPLLGKARVPVRAIHLVNFGLVVLAAYGLDRVLLGSSQVWVRRVKLVLLSLAALIFATAVWRGNTPDSMLWGACAALTFAIVLHARPSHAALSAVLLAIVVLELYPVANVKLASQHDKAAFQFVRTFSDNADVVEFLRSEPFPRRMAVNSTDIPTNFGDVHAIDMMEGYLAGTSSNLTRFGRHTRGAQKLLGVTHIVAREQDKPHHVEAFRGASGIKVFRNPDALPRAWAVHRVDVLTDESQLGGRIDHPAFDPGRTALILGKAPELETCEPGAVDVVTYAPNRIRLRAAMNCRGLVNLSDTYYPGWQATVDGRRVEILETYGALRGVVVEKGSHEIEFVYKPRSVYGGVALTLLGLLVVVMVPVVERRGRGDVNSKTDVAPASMTC